MKRFDELLLMPTLARAIREAGYETPTPVQAQAIGPALEGRDVLGSAQTGTGKTAAFALPTLQRLFDGDIPAHPRPARALVLAPTRELASQIDESFRTYGRHTDLRTVVIYGGVSQRPQVRKLREGVDVVVACPGRLLDLMGQGEVDLGSVETLILDEADRMLDMGFMPDIRRIIKKLPEPRQTLLFSATVPKEIRRLSQQLLNNPVTVQVAAESSAAEQVDQFVTHVTYANKTSLLMHYLGELPMDRTIVFTRTRRRADRLARQISKAGVSAAAIHGDRSQNQRRKALGKFSRGDVAVLVATDVASRGLDVDDISHVINFDVPRDAESYVHRIGRTARAGADGVAITFCDHEERPHLKAIERLLGEPVPVRRDDADLGVAPPEPGGAPRSKKKGHTGGKKRSSKGSNRGGNGRHKNKKKGAQKKGSRRTQRRKGGTSGKPGKGVKRRGRVPHPVHG
ncbi:MAG: DEAD/DEAH box helicase [Phycisphaeraceae bacterium]|nr:DEAD/DEAH box helicase [Phycisphaeraceae bacterium]